jgi:hypothetical protein
MIRNKAFYASILARHASEEDLQGKGKYFKSIIVLTLFFHHDFIVNVRLVLLVWLFGFFAFVLLNLSFFELPIETNHRPLGQVKIIR